MEIVTGLHDILSSIKTPEKDFFIREDYLMSNAIFHFRKSSMRKSIISNEQAELFENFKAAFMALNKWSVE